MASLRTRRARRALSRSTLVAGLAVAATTLAGACLTLDDISQNVCGNRVLDPGEDCDTTKETVENGYKGTCTAAGSANECKFPVACDIRADGCAPQCAADAEGCVAQCPTGFRAGLDGICHRPSGEFTDPPIAVAITGIEPRVIDLDGDGEKDLMIDGQDREHLAFVQSGIVRSVSEIRKSLDARVSVGKLNRDRITPDIVVPTGASTHDSFALFRGTVGGPPEAYTFPAYEVGAPFRVVPVSSLIFGDPKHGDTFSAGLLMDCTAGTGQLCGFAGLDGRRVMLIDPAVADGNTWRRTTSLPVDEAFAKSRLLTVPFRNADDACVDTLIVSEGGALNDLRIIKPCEATPLPKDIATQSVATPGFPPTCRVRALMTAASTSGNHDDVYASLLCGAEVRFAALYYPAQNTPTLRSGCPSGGACVVSNNESSCPSISVRHILAVGDFNADGELDYGASDGIYFGDPAGDPGFTAGAPPDQHADFACWGAAIASDFNADGVVDLAAAPKDAAGLNVMLGAKQSLLASTTLGTNETIVDAAVGDFDGDGTKDIAIALDASGGEACDDQPPNDIAIYFGKAQGFPEDGQIIGSVANIVQLAGGVLYRDATGVASDGLADLAAITQRDTQGCALQRGSLFTGSATRSIVTPYNMLVRARGILRPAIDIQAISVVDSAYAAEPQLAVVMNDKNGSYIDVLKTGTGDTLIPDGCPNTALSLAQCPELHKFDFGDKKIVAAAIAPMGDRIAAAGSLEGVPAVQVFIEAGPTLDVPTKLAVFPTNFPVERINLVVGDFDGDGRADLAVLAFARPLPALNASSHVQIFLADQLVEGGAGCTYVDPEANIVGLAPLDIGAGNDLVIATTQSVKRIAGIDASCKPTASFPIPSVGNLPLEGGDIQSIAVGDLNADGVDDIAVAAHDRTLILRQSTTTEYERTKADAPPPEE